MLLNEKIVHRFSFVTAMSASFVSVTHNGITRDVRCSRGQYTGNISKKENRLSIWLIMTIVDSTHIFEKILPNFVFRINLFAMQSLFEINERFKFSLNYFMLCHKYFYYDV